MTSSTLPHLADAAFLRQQASQALRPYVSWYWQMFSANTISQCRNEFMHANGSVLVTFNYGQALAMDKGEIQSGITISRPSDVSRLLALRGQLSCFGILLKPGAVYSIFNIPANKIAQLTPADYPIALQHLHYQLAQVETFERRVIEAEKALLRILDKTRLSIPHSVKLGLQYVQSMQASFSIQDLMRQMPVGQRQLERHFQEHLGLTLKQYSRIIRVGHARQMLKHSPAASLADIAINSGFFDQSHFHRDFNRVVGMAPGRYRKRQIHIPLQMRSEY
ncbi:HTH-type transcriptional activator RhaR [Thalassocella blandensis]|nr:HTH-type transcriptional activator RhaR [Thalassocella blandensis]